MNMSRGKRIFIFVNLGFSIFVDLLGLWPSSFGVSVGFVASISVSVAFLEFIFNFNFFSLFRAVRVSLFSPVHAISIAIVAFGMWLVFASFVYRVFPNWPKGISEFEYFLVCNKIFLGMMYVLIAVVSWFIAKKIASNEQKFSNFSNPKKLNFLAAFILCLGAFIRVLVYFDIN